MNLRAWLLAPIAFLLLLAPALAQDRYGHNQNPGVVPMIGCTTANAECAGPVGAANPMPVTVNGGGAAVTGTVTSPAIGTTDTTLTGSAGAASYVDVFNPSANTVCVNFAATATISGTTCAGGEYTIPPLWHRSWPDDGSAVLPPLPLHAIASGAGTTGTLTVK
jgi:hypothetical protein